MTIKIVRHGETTFNSEGRFQGQSLDKRIRLTEKGERETADTFQNVKPDILICSTLFRCIQTAEILAGNTFDQIEKHFYDGLKEINGGLLEDQFFTDLEKVESEFKKVWDSWKKDPQNFIGFPQGKNLLEFQERVLKTFSEICNRYGDTEKDIYVITHSGPIRILLNCFLANKDLSHYWDTTISNLQTIELTKEQIIKLKNYSCVAIEKKEDGSSKLKNASSFWRPFPTTPEEEFELMQTTNPSNRR